MGGCLRRGAGGEVTSSSAFESIEGVVREHPRHRRTALGHIPEFAPGRDSSEHGKRRSRTSPAKGSGAELKAWSACMGSQHVSLHRGFPRKHLPGGPLRTRAGAVNVARPKRASSGSFDAR